MRLVSATTVRAAQRSLTRAPPHHAPPLLHLSLRSRLPIVAGNVVIQSSAYSLLSLLPGSTSQKESRERLPSPPPLPQPQRLQVHDDCVVEYVDLRAREDTSYTLVLVHGAPGTYHDYRHLIPILQEQSPHVRLLGINLPGFGGSDVAHERYFDRISALGASQVTLDALHQLCGVNERVFLLGHSFGGHTAINLAALNLQASDSSPQVRIDGMVLLASAGARPHRVLRPRERTFTVFRLLQSRLAPVRYVLPLALKAFYTTILRFPSQFPPSHFVAGVVRAATTDFSTLQTQIAQLRAACVPTLSAWSVNDEFMEDEIPAALAAALGSSRRVVFEGAGHNLQKTRATQLAQEIIQWTDHVSCVNESQCDGTQLIYDDVVLHELP
ncbi:hypothetical protein Poli38472_014111 [Pythium oligandrum]|uniref:AB hydrolase-1 domain-containing protein n=1 Tax=Pythium oligandrum TaxID=41045 RepID=A0A8K1CPD4_PYTOL|nr:hypothetical protein Poli38472_014111 [Pythium oligandrum]|eukprot:TMW66799.1 hypothetical protein Poli38472_014111 [Pythium oligandrum]